MSVDACVEDVESIPGYGEDGVKLKITAVRFFVGLQLAFGVFVGQVGLVLV